MGGSTGRSTLGGGEGGREGGGERGRRKEEGGERGGRKEGRGEGGGKRGKGLSLVTTEFSLLTSPSLLCLHWCILCTALFDQLLRRTTPLQGVGSGRGVCPVGGGWRRGYCSPEPHPHGPDRGRGLRSVIVGHALKESCRDVLRLGAWGACLLGERAC